MLELHREPPKPKTHRIKCWPRFFGPIANGHQTYNVRRNDRDYKAGDFLMLCEWHPPSAEDLGGGYTGAYVLAVISNIQDSGDLTFADGNSLVSSDIIVMGIAVMYRDLSPHQNQQLQPASAPPSIRVIQ